MEVLRPFRYWTLWMSKWHMVALHHCITVYNDMFDYMDGIFQALAKKNTQRKEDLYVTMKFAPQILSKCCTELTATPGMILISAHILDPFRKFQSFQKWDKGMDTNPEDETSCSTQDWEAFLMWVENEYHARHQRLPIIQPGTVWSNNLFFSAMASISGQSSYDPYDLSSDDKEYLMPRNVCRNDTQTKRLRSMPTDSRIASFEFTSWKCIELGAN